MVHHSRRMWHGRVCLPQLPQPQPSNADDQCESGGHCKPPMSGIRPPRIPVRTPKKVYLALFVGRVINHGQRRVLATLTGAPPVWTCARTGLRSIQAEGLERVALVGDVRGICVEGVTVFGHATERAHPERNTVPGKNFSNTAR